MTKSKSFNEYFLNDSNISGLTMAENADTMKQEGIFMNEELNYTVRNMHAVQYVPSMVHFHNKGRTTSAFLYILEGSFLYKTAEGQKKAERWYTVFLPIFSEYSYEIVSGKAECIYVEFILETVQKQIKK